MLVDLLRKMNAELTGHILPFWSEKAVDRDHGGFYGRITHTGEIISEAPRSAVLNTRILWTFSAAYRRNSDPGSLDLAARAFDYIETFFNDSRYGGIYWMVGHDGTALDTKKHAYAMAFAIYAFSEYYRASGEHKALNRAMELFRLLGEKSCTQPDEFYYEAFDRKWKRLKDVRLSASDQKERYSMNTQLHLLEAFTTLYRIRPDALVQDRLRGLIDLFIKHIYDGSAYHFHAFFDEKRKPVPLPYSYGHDIEAIWLLTDAALVLNDTGLIKKTEAIARDVACNLITEGYDDQMGGIFNTGLNGEVYDSDKHWWSQAEAIVGFLEVYRITGEPVYVEKALHTWNFIESRLIDPAVGEWHFRVNSRGEPYTDEDKLGPWKCPYHTARACLEAAERINKLQLSSIKTETVSR